MGLIEGNAAIYFDKSPPALCCFIISDWIAIAICWPSSLPFVSLPSTSVPPASTFTFIFTEPPSWLFGVMLPDPLGVKISGPRSPTT